MVFIYCDDSFFLDSDFSKKMNHKLEVIIKEKGIQCVCISVSKNVDQYINALASKFTGTTFIKSYNRVKFEDCEVVLNNGSLNLLDEEIHPFSGSICLIDTVTKKWNRVYLDLFPDQETDVSEILNNAFEDFIHDLFKTTDKEN